MSASLRIILACGVVIYFSILFLMLRKKKMNLKYSLLWLFIGVIFALIDIFPQIIFSLAQWMSIQTPINILFLLAFCFVLLLLMSLTSIVSGQRQEIKRLIQNVSLLQNRVDELEKKNKE